MSIQLKVPEVGESITEVQIGEWLKSEGDPVKRDEVLVMIETDKVTVELPSPVDGVLTKISTQNGEQASVGDVIGEVSEGQASVEQASNEQPSKAKPPAASKPPYQGIVWASGSISPSGSSTQRRSRCERVTALMTSWTRAPWAKSPWLVGPPSRISRQKSWTRLP